jgi:hypothetical protein
MKTVEKSVASIDADRAAYFTRSPDRPQARVIARSRKAPEIKKAESRLRTAAWRIDLDKRGRPESDTVAVTLLLCLIDVARESGHEVADMPEVKKAFDKLFDTMAERGYQRTEVEAVIKRMTRRSKTTVMSGHLAGRK